MLLLPPEIMEKYSFHLDAVRAAVPTAGVLDLAPVASLQFVFLCFTNRCGSNFIAETLASDGQLNLAFECWNSEQVIRTVQERLAFDLPGYFSGVSQHSARGGRFVSKLGIEHVALLHATGLLEPVIAQSRFIMIERADKLGQAISMSIADGTSWWASYNTPLRQASELVFSRDAIDACLDLILDQNALFDRFFAQNGIVPTWVNYEQFVQYPDQMTQHVGSALGLPKLRNVPANLQVSRQSGAVNRIWRELYLAETR